MSDQASPGGVNPWTVAIVVSIATFMEVLDTTIANVALRYIAGGLAVGPDESAWVVTSYLVANAVVLCASGWLARIFGRKRFYMACVALFTLSSVLCGLAWNLESLLMFRVLQGLGGGGMAPVSQSILATAFPPAKRGQAFALYGIAVVVAPAIGPTLGGWLSDAYSWHWCFFINAPVGVGSLILVWLLVQDPPELEQARQKLLKGGVKFDTVGFALIAVCLGTLEVMLDRGQREDWFESPFILVMGLTSLICLLLFIPWELAKKDPVVDVRILGSSRFAACFGIMLATGGILIASTQFLPQLVQDLFGYTATVAGLALSPGGFVTILMMLVAGRLVSTVPPRYMILVGSSVMAVSMWRLTATYADLNFSWFVWARVYIGIGLPLIFITVTNASYDGLRPDQTDQASALINVARNLGGSICVSLAQNVLAYREQFHQTRLAERFIPSSPAYQAATGAAQSVFTAQSTGSTTAVPQQVTQYLGQALQTQSSYLGYVDVWWAMFLVALACLPLALILRGRSKPGGQPAGGH